jgi:uncharacterized integral membrane protein
MRLRRRPGKLDETYQLRLWLILGGLLLLVAYVIYFVIANDERVAVEFLFFSARTSLIWVILLCLAIGLLLGVLLSQLYRRRHTREASSATPSSIRSGDS